MYKQICIVDMLHSDICISYNRQYFCDGLLAWIYFKFMLMSYISIFIHWNNLKVGVIQKII